jgi:hypothetical protein
MSMGGEIVEELYDELIYNYRKKLESFAKLLSNEYPKDAQKLLDDFYDHFNTDKKYRIKL